VATCREKGTIKIAAVVSEQLARELFKPPEATRSPSDYVAVGGI
jgi:hypothetical protein